ncbi:MAG: glucoamylase family protein [Gammaproteobacteria bacterium]
MQTVRFPEHGLNLDNVDAPLAEPGGARRLERLEARVRYRGREPLIVRLELEDTRGRKRFARFEVKRSSGIRTLTWKFRNSGSFREAQRRRFDLKSAKVVILVIERRHLADGVTNPRHGTLDIHGISFVPNRPEVEPGDPEARRDLLARRALQYFFDWTSRKPGSQGIPQDRSTFADLLTVGGIGFALPAYIIAAEHGFITRADAANRTVAVLRILDNDAAFSPGRVGFLGHRGFFYHFLGVDGRRKLNFDFAETPIDESRNTVELSTIDTSLALLGVLTAQSYFSGGDAIEAEIRSRAQAIYERVDWPFMLEPVSQQFFLGWKPNEQRDGPAFEFPDSSGQGRFSGIPGDPATWDFYTDEVLLITLMALGSTTHPVPDAVYCAFVRNRSASGLIRSFPGSLFTYQFLHAFIDTDALGDLICPGQPVEDWFANSQLAMRTGIDYAVSNPSGFPTYGPEAWGITACEGPEDGYHAYGAPPLAIQNPPEEDGTIAYYGMLSAASYGPDLLGRADSALAAAWDRGHWHYRFGLPDAFHSDVAGIVAQHPEIPWVRRAGPWLQRALFAIDQGPTLLHLENTRSRLIQDLLAGNPNIVRGLARLPRQAQAPSVIRIEGESTAVGDGIIIDRSNASGLKTVSLQSDQSRTWQIQSPASARYTVAVRYSNDNFGPLDDVEVLVDGGSVNHFAAQDTGDFGFGWNVFVETGSLGTVDLAAGEHDVRVKVTGGDGFGVEVDAITFDRVE